MKELKGLGVYQERNRGDAALWIQDWPPPPLLYPAARNEEARRQLQRFTEGALAAAEAAAGVPAGGLEVRRQLLLLKNKSSFERHVDDPSGKA